MKPKVLLTSLFLTFAMTYVVPLVLAVEPDSPNDNLNINLDIDQQKQQDRIVQQLAHGSEAIPIPVPGRQGQLFSQGLSGSNGRNANQVLKSIPDQRPLGYHKVPEAAGNVAGNGNRARRNQTASGGLRNPALAVGGMGSPQISNTLASENQTTGLAQPNGNTLRGAGQRLQPPSSALTNTSNFVNNIPDRNRLNSRLPPSAQLDVDDDERNNLEKFKDLSQSLALPKIVSAASEELPQEVAIRVQQLLEEAANLLASYSLDLSQAINTFSFAVTNRQLMQKLNRAFIEGFDDIENITDLGIGTFFDIAEQALGVVTGMAGALIESTADGIGAFTRPGKRFAGFIGDTGARATSNIPFLSTAVRSGSRLGYTSLDLLDQVGNNELKNLGRNIRNRGQQTFLNGDMNNEERHQEMLQKRRRVNRMPNDLWSNPINQDTRMMV